jgi:NADH-quinone oxidoreductase subunit F
MKILLDRIDEPGLNTLEVYERRGGYQSLRKALGMPPDQALNELMDSGIRGRGGAGFPMGRKASFLPHGEMDKYLVCNADESEPGTFKDREIMQKNPHMLIEGILITSWAAEINRTFIYIRGEYAMQADILEAAIAEARDAGYIGENILGSDHSVSLVLHRGAGACSTATSTARPCTPTTTSIPPSRLTSWASGCSWSGSETAPWTSPRSCPGKGSPTASSSRRGAAPG